MNLLKNNILLLYIALLLNSISGFAQNLFDLEHSLKFADYLFENSMYKEAAAEYERVIFMDSLGQNAKLQCIKAYEYSGNYALAQKKLNSFYAESNLQRPEVLYQQYRLYILQQNFDAFGTEFFENSKFEPTDRAILGSSAAIISGNFELAAELLKQQAGSNNEILQNYSILLNDAGKTTHKSVAVAVLLATVLPGSGKIYTGYWKDGLITLVFTGLSALQAYRGFEKSGITSTYGWIYAGMTTGFYLGNIYGAGKSAYKHNHEKKHKIIHRAEAIFTNYRR